MNVQAVPTSSSLIAQLPGGRDYHSPILYKLPLLSESSLSALRAPPEQSGFTEGDTVSDSEEEVQSPLPPAGAFPGTASQYTNTGAKSGYY